MRPCPCGTWSRRTAAFALLASLVCVALPAIAQVPAMERDALIALYNSTNGAGWTNSTGWLGAEGTECTWFGVTCSGGSVTSLNLNSNQLNGSIPAELGNLSSLQYLYLYSNQLSGAIPVELGSLSSLVYLGLYSNQLSGGIPAQLGSLPNLQFFYLHLNQLSGSIPVELGNLSALQRLYLRDNQLSGSLPSQLGNLSNLQKLDLGSNQLSGNIPAELGNLSSLQSLGLNYNQLSGSIPAELGNLPNLQYLYLYSNQLSGNIPVELGNLSSLQALLLYSNQLSGSIPAELGNLSNLQVLQLDWNQLGGSIPAELGNLSNLGDLRLAYNQLGGGIPPTLGNLPNLQYLYLQANQLSGSIPAELGNLSALLQLYLNSNQLSGSIPSSLASLTTTQYIALGYNALYATDPGVDAWATSRQADWKATQTVAPTNPGTSAVTVGSITVGWTPIAYSSGTGYYRVLASTTAGGPYTPAGMTASKSVSSLQVSGLAPGTTYYFVADATTEPHALNQNQVRSEVSAEVSATTLYAPPTIAMVSPASGPPAGATAVTVSGTGFVAGASLTFGGSAASSVTVVDATMITATTPAHAAGAVDVVVTNPDLQSATLSAGYTYVASVPAISSVSPSSGPSAGGTAVTVSGTGFAAGASLTFGGSTASSVTVVDATTITATTPAHAAEAVDVVVTNPDLQSATLPNGFTYVASGPTIASVSPSMGPASGGTAVTVSGTGFVAGASLTFGGSAGFSVTVVDATTITSTTPAHAAGEVDVVVTNSDLQSATLPSGFTYVAAGPTIASVSPSMGPASGGTAITVSGSDFQSGAGLTFGGTAATNVVVVNATTITATTPAHLAGSVDVTVTNPGSASATAFEAFEYKAGAEIVVGANPEPIFAEAGTSGPAVSFAIANTGGVTTTVSLARTATFFTISSDSVEIRPGESRTVTIQATLQPVGAHTGSVALSGEGVPQGLSVPVTLIVYGPAGVDVPDVAPVRVRIGVGGPGPIVTGSVGFRNEGTAAVTGVLVAEAPWLLPVATPVTIGPGQTSTTPFTVNRAFRLDPDSLESLFTVIRFVYPPITTGAGRVATAESGSQSGSTAGDTPTLAVQTNTLPSVGAGQLGLVVPGIRSLEQAGRRFVSDVVLSATARDDDLGMYFLGSGASMSAALRAARPTPIAPGVPLLLADVVGKGFERPAEKGSLHLRSVASSGLTVDAIVSAIDDARRLAAYWEAPVARSDRGARPGEVLYLPGVSELGGPDATLFVQELTGEATRFEVQTLDAGGKVIQTSGAVELEPFQMREQNWTIPAGAATIVVLNTGAAGRIAAVCEEAGEELDARALWDATSIYGGTRSEALVVPWVATAASGEPAPPVRMRPVRPGGAGGGGGTGAKHRATSLAIFSPLGASVELELRTAARSANARVELGPGETKTWTDVLSDLFVCRVAESGSLIVRPERGEIAVGAWYESLAGEAWVVTSVPVIPASAGLGMYGTMVFHGVRDASQASIAASVPADAATPALGLIETGGGVVTVEVRVTHETSNPAAAQPLRVKSYTLGSGQVMMLDDIVRQVAGQEREKEGNLYKASVTVTVRSGTGRVLPFLVTRVVSSGDLSVRVR